MLFGNMRIGEHPVAVRRSPNARTFVPHDLATALSKRGGIGADHFEQQIHGVAMRSYPPIRTKRQPATIAPPCAVVSPMRAAGLFEISTVAEPSRMESGGPTHTHVSPTTAAGRFPMRTVGT